MIIFNIDALLLLILIIPLSYLTSSIDPEFSSIGHPINFCVIIFSSVIAEGINLKPKLFYLPTWLLFTALLIITTFSNYDFIKGLIAIVFIFVMIFIAYLISTIILNKKWKKAKELLKEFLNNKNISPDKLICYPNYIYTNSPFYEKYLELMYVFFQKKWFNRPDVKNHYLVMLEELNRRNTTEKNIKQNQHLKHLLDNNVKNGIYKFMLDNLAQNEGFGINNKP